MTLLAADPSAGEAQRMSRAVLVTDGDAGQGRSAIAAVRALAAAGYRPTVTVSGTHVLAAASRYCDGELHTLPAAAPAYAAAIRAEMATGRYLGALPTSDAAIIALGLPGAALLNKDRLNELAHAAGIATIPAVTVPSVAALRASPSHFQYPVVVKSAVVQLGSPKVPAFRIESPRGLTALPPTTGPLLIQPYLNEAMTALAGVVWRGRLVAAVHQRYERTWPADCGTASFAVTTEPDFECEQRVLRLLQGYDGIFQAQFIGGRLIDVNPRVYGSLPLAVAAGANLPAILCGLTSGQEVQDVRGRAGVAYRWLEGDARHLVKGVRDRTVPLRGAIVAMRPKAGTAHSVVSLRDLRPALVRLSYARSRRHRY